MSPADPTRPSPPPETVAADSLETPVGESTLPIDGPSSRPGPEGQAAQDSVAGGYRRALTGRSYAIQDELAKGGVGRILRARDEGLERPVAVKELLEHTPETESRFMREALLTARLQHPSIVPVYDAGRWPSGEPFYAMKLVAGRPFSRVIEETRSIDERLALLPHVLAAAEAIAYAHSEGIIHRDLKPQNILVGAFGETVVIDWGLAKDLRNEAPEGDTDAPLPEVTPLADTALTMTGTILGTPIYMAPEQAAGRSADARADVYALGAILYHLLAGRPPYSGPEPLEVVQAVVRGPPEPIERLQQGVPRDLVTLVHKAMARHVDERYPSARELAEELRRFQTGQIVRAHHYSPTERLARFVRRYRVPLGTLATALIATTLMGVLAIVRIVEARDQATQERDRATLAEKRATERADTLTLAEARGAAARNPIASIAWLKTLSPAFTHYRVARVIAADALTRSVPRVLRGHTAVVNRVRFSPDGRLLATVSDDRSVRLWDVATGAVRVLEGHADEVWAVAFSPDGKLLASSGKDGVLRLWRTDTAEGRALQGQHDGPVGLLRFLADGRRIVSRGRQEQVRLWDVERGVSSVLRGGPGADQDLAVSPDGRTVAYTAEGALVLFHVTDGTYRRFPGQRVPATLTAFSSDGTRVVTGDGTGTLRVWDPMRGVLRELTGHTGEITAISFLPLDASRFVSAARDGRLRRWNLHTGESEVLGAHEGVVHDMVSSPDGQTLLSAGGDNTARLWELASGTSRVLRGQNDAVLSVSFSPDGRRVAVTGADQSVCLYELDALRDRVVTVHGAAVRAMAVSAEGARVAFAGADGTVKVTSLGGGEPQVVARHDGAVNALTFSSDGALVATAGADGRIRLFAFDSRVAWVLDGHKGAVHHLAFSRDRALLFSSGADGTVRAWALPSGEGRIVEQRSAGASTVALSPDGAYLLSGWRDGRVKVRERRSNRELLLEGHLAPVQVLGFSPGARVVVSGSLDHTLRLWDVETGQLRHTLDASGTGIERLLFFQDGKRFATLGGEANARIWDLESGRLLSVLRGHRGRVNALAVSADGTRAATGGNDGTVRLWDLEAGESRVLEGHRGGVTALDFALGGRALISAGQDGTVRRWMDDLPTDGPTLRAVLEAATPETIESLGVHPGPR